MNQSLGTLINGRLSSADSLGVLTSVGIEVCSVLAWENLLSTQVAYLWHLNKCLCLPCFTSFETFVDNLRAYLAVWICRSFNSRADCQKQISLWDLYATGIRAIQPSHATGTENYTLSHPGHFFHLIGMDVAAAVPVGRSRQWQDWTRIPEIQLERHMHAYTCTCPPVCRATKTNTDRKHCCHGTHINTSSSHIHKHR